MLGDEIVLIQPSRNPRRQFVVLIRQGRFDAALRCAEKTKLPQEIFKTRIAQQGGVHAVTLALLIGEPEDAEQMRKGFLLSRDVYTHPEVRKALYKKRTYYRSAGFARGLEVLNVLYVPYANFAAQS